MHAVLDSEDWEAIADGAYCLCVACIDVRLAAKGMTAECEIQFRGSGLRSAMTPRLAKAGAWRPPEYVERESVGLPNLYT